MARIRTVKPEFWHNEELSGISSEACLLALGLLNFADDEGYFKANPKLIEAATFPLRELSLSIHGLISELSNIKYITIYSGEDGKKYGLVNNFLKHQKINRPNESKIKGLCKFTEQSLSDHGGLTVGTGNREQGMEQGKEEEQGTREASSTSLNPEDYKSVDGKAYHDYMTIYETIKGYDITKVNVNARSVFNEAAQTISEAQILTAVKDYKTYCEAMSEPVKFRKTVIKFLTEMGHKTNWILQCIEKDNWVTEAIGAEWGRREGLEEYQQYEWSN